jgi:hypothetical protein
MKQNSMNDNKKKTFGLIHADTLIHSDVNARDFWESLKLDYTFGKNKYEFINELIKDFTFNDKDTIFPLEIGVLIDPSDDGIVSVSDFNCFLKWFGPYKDCLKNVEEILKFEWFWGSLTKIEANEILKTQLIGFFFFILKLINNNNKYYKKSYYIYFYY